jgi:hypothetical protein
MRLWLVRVLVVVAASSASVTARAQDTRPAAPAPGQAAPAGAAAGGNMEEAQRRFKRGSELYKEGDLAAALVEMKRAYELVPSFKILYNLGQVAYQMHDYAGALRYFRQYLDVGQSAVPPDRRRELADEIPRLEQRVGRLDISTVDRNLDVFVDDAAVGRSPLAAPVTVNEGRRRIEVVGAGGARRSSVVEVPGGELVRVSFPALGAEAASLAPAPAPAHPAPLLVSAQSAGEAPAKDRDRPAAARARVPWWPWIATALLAGGAATTGAFAWSDQRDLERMLDDYPADGAAIASSRNRTHTLALTTDGLLAGTVLMGALALYLSY